MEEEQVGKYKGSQTDENEFHGECSYTKERARLCVQMERRLVSDSTHYNRGAYEVYRTGFNWNYWLHAAWDM